MEAVSQKRAASRRLRRTRTDPRSGLSTTQSTPEHSKKKEDKEGAQVQHAQRWDKAPHASEHRLGEVVKNLQERSKRSRGCPELGDEAGDDPHEEDDGVCVKRKADYFHASPKLELVEEAALFNEPPAFLCRHLDALR